jgi:hypothetical protein
MREDIKKWAIYIGFFGLVSLVGCLLFCSITHAQQWGFYKAREVVTPGERASTITVGTEEVARLDEEGLGGLNHETNRWS